MSEPKRKPGRPRKHIPDPLGGSHQFNLDQENKIREVLLEETPGEIQERLRQEEDIPLVDRVAFEAALFAWLGGEVIEKSYRKTPEEEGRGGDPYTTVYNNNYYISPPPGEEVIEKPCPCLYGDPMTRETIRRQLLDLGIASINQLLRTWTAGQLIEAIDDFERCLEVGMRIRNRTSFFRSLLR